MSDKRADEIKRLQEKAAGYMKRANALQEQINEEVWIPLLRKSIGKCFTYSNSYGSGERWPIYARIISCAGMNFTAVQFQHTSRRRVEIEYEQVYNFNGVNRFNLQHGWQEISVNKYNAARRKALAFVQELLGGRQP